MASFSQKRASDAPAEGYTELRITGLVLCFLLQLIRKVGDAYLSSNSPGTKRNHNLLITNVLEILGLPGDINLASPGKWLFAMTLIIRWLQIKGLPGDICTSKSQWLEEGSSGGKLKF